MSRGLWKNAPKDRDRAAEIAEEFSLDPMAALLLTARGITDDEEIEEFLFAEDFYVDPFEIKDIDKAVERINRAVENYEKIMIFGDYDADGVTSTSLIYLYLASKGADIGYYIPDRMNEGYGISCDRIRDFADEGVKLIVTVDNGINAVEETALANSLGMDVVITDHHKVGDTLPDAVAVVNPHRADCQSSFKEYAGVGVAFKLVCALDGDSEEMLEQYCDLAAIGTLADVVPLTGENRIIVKKGIEKINKNARPGLKALRTSAGADSKVLNATSVAFTLAPRINAAGRMDSAMLAMKLLLDENAASAADLAAKLESANRQRHEVENEITQKAVEYIESNDEVKYSPIIVVSGEGWHQGVIGIVASRLVSRYGKPAVVITTDGDEGKGSCRSLEDFSIYDALNSVNDMLTHFGGHTLAAGFGIRTGDIPVFRKRLADYCMQREMPFPSLNIDLTVNPSIVTVALLDVLKAFEPFGANNPQPCFAIKGATLRAIRPVGEGKHLRLTLRKDDAEITAMLFSTTAEQFPYEIGDTIDIAFRVEKNEFRGEITPSVQIIDIRYSDFDYYKCVSSVRIYEKFKSGVMLSENEVKHLTPDRAFFAGVYKYFRTKKSVGFDLESFCHVTNCPYRNAGRVLLCVDILCELGLLEKTDGGYAVTENPQRVELNSSVILRNLTKEG